MHVLFVDESGTHPDSRVFVLGGVAVHEDHLGRASQYLHAVVESRAHVQGVDPETLELHAADMRNPRPAGKNRPKSPWRDFTEADRNKILRSGYDALGTFRCGQEGHGCCLFGVVVDKRFHGNEPKWRREQVAYEHLLTKFDNLLTRHPHSGQGLVVHDQRLVAERDIREWTRFWQTAAGVLGGLSRVADVPLFADSRGSRLLQGADLVAYALHRHYNIEDESYTRGLWSEFDTRDGKMHGAIHLTPQFQQGCACPPCSRRAR